MLGFLYVLGKFAAYICVMLKIRLCAFKLYIVKTLCRAVLYPCPCKSTVKRTFTIHNKRVIENVLNHIQVAWLKEDLAAAQANRANVPWIMVSSHFPIVHKAVAENRK